MGKEITLASPFPKLSGKETPSPAWLKARGKPF